MEFKLTSEEKKILLKLARETIEEWVRKTQKPALPDATENLKAICGAFVTLNKHGQLRGCIGNMVGHVPLLETIQNMAIAASTQDSRFERVCEEELGDIDIEISVLSPLQRIKDVSEIEVGKHGILLGNSYSQGVLLPQVATEYGWDRETFLKQTCQKAGLPENAWQDPETIIEIFSAEIFGEISD